MKKKVLLIDDSMTIHRVIDLSIDDELYSVEKAFTSDDAEVKYRNLKPDIILLDNKLEGVKLPDYTAKLKSDTGAYVILLVGAFDQFSQADLAGSGADDYIVKPFNSTLLNQKLNSAPIADTEKLSATSFEEEENKDEAIQELFDSIDSDQKVEDLVNFDSVIDESVLDTPQTTEEEIEVTKADEVGTEFSEVADILETEPENINEDENPSEESFEDIFKDIEPLKEDAAIKNETDDLEFEISPVKEEQPEDKFEELGKDLDKDLLSDIFSESDSNIELPAENLEDETDSSTYQAELNATEVVHEVTEESFEEPIFQGETPDTDLTKNYDVEVLSETFEVDEVEGVNPIQTPLEDKTEIEFSGEDKKSGDEEVLAHENLDGDALKVAIEKTIDLDFVKNIVREVLTKNLEKAVWEIVPDMAERLIIQEIERLKKGE